MEPGSTAAIALDEPKPALVSVIVPTYNRSHLLTRALASVMAQTYRPIEFIVVDDASSEDISASVREATAGTAIVISRDVRGGAAAARNSGCDVARGDYIAFLDSDDEWLPQKLEAQIAFLERNRELALCCTAFNIIRDNGRSETRSFGTGSYGLADLAFGCGISPGSTLVFRRDLLTDVGPFDTGLARFEDWDWLLRSLAHSRIGLVDTPYCNVFAGAHPSEQKVLSSLREIKLRHGTTFLRHGIRHYLHFRAGLFHEESAAAYCEGKYVRAIGKLVLSFLVYPVRKRDLVTRLIRASTSSRDRGTGTD